jgi:hypothetical protein
MDQILKENIIIIIIEKNVCQKKKNYKVEFHDNIMIKDKKKKTVSSQPKLGYQTCNLDCVAESTS